MMVSGAVPRRGRRPYLDERVLGWNVGTDGTDSALPERCATDSLYFNCRILSRRNCPSGSGWVSARAFS